MAWTAPKVQAMLRLPKLNPSRPTMTAVSNRPIYTSPRTLAAQEQSSFGRH